MTDLLGNAFPGIAKQLPKYDLANLPTPISQHEVNSSDGRRSLLVKHDNLTSDLYGGNKVRKLEYILRRATDRGACRIATFGAAGSHHALATAVHARKLDLDCLCFLAHQKRTREIAAAINRHLDIGTQIVRYGGSIETLPLFRKHLHKTRTWVVPLGGTCWYGAVGFVNAGLELAAQIDDGEIDCPDRVYIANGTMGSVAGLSLGLALGRLPIDLHAVRVAGNRFTNPEVLTKLIAKTARLLQRCDSRIPLDIADRVRVVWRDEFFAGGYASVNDATTAAVRFAADGLDLTLETTYTGKAMAALLADMASSNGSSLFWNTYGGRPGDTAINSCPTTGIPRSFRRYYS